MLISKQTWDKGHLMKLALFFFFVKLHVQACIINSVFIRTVALYLKCILPAALQLPALNKRWPKATSQGRRRAYLLAVDEAYAKELKTAVVFVFCLLRNGKKIFPVMCVWMSLIIPWALPHFLPLSVLYLLGLCLSLLVSTAEVTVWLLLKVLFTSGQAH